MSFDDTTASDTAIHLVVASGHHAGARIAVDRPAILVGSDGQADVILTDAGIAPLHAVLMCQQGVFSLRALAGEVFVDDRPVAHECLVSAGQSIGMGGVHLVLEGAPVRPGGGAGQVPDAPDASDGASFAALHDRYAASGARALAPSRGSAARMYWLCAAGLLVAAGASLWTTAGFGAPSPDAAQAAGQAAASDPVAALRLWLAKRHLAEVVVRADAQGRVVLTGMVADAAELEALRLADLRQFPGIRELRLKVDTGSAQATRLAVMLDDPGVSVRYQAPHSLVLEGVAKRAETSSKILRFTRDFQGTFEIVSRVAYREAVMNTGTVPPQSRTPPIKVAHVTSGGAPYVTAFDGAQYFQGAKLADGSEIVRITEDKLVMRTDGRLIEYQFH